MQTFIPPGKEYDNYNVYTEKIEFKTAKSTMESGVVERRALRAYPLRTFVLQYEVLTEEEAQYIFNFFLARKGGFEAFFWTHKDVQYIVNFDEDVLNLARFAYQLYNLGEIRLLESR